MRKTAAYAFHHSIPILIGFFPVGIAYGLLMQQAGYNFLWSGACSLFVLAGSLQFLMVTFFAGGVSLATVAVLALLLNSRHIFYGLSFIDRFRSFGPWRWFLIYSLCDENYSLHCSHDFGPDVNEKWAYVLTAALVTFYWVALSMLGGLVGSLITFDTTGIDFALTALFTVIVVDQLRGAHAHPRRGRGRVEHRRAPAARAGQVPAAVPARDGRGAHAAAPGARAEICRREVRRHDPLRRTEHRHHRGLRRVHVFERWLPWLLFGRRAVPKVVEYLGRILPMAVMVSLLVYCLRGMQFTSAGAWVPQVIAVGVTAGLHWWRRNTLLSIAAGTVCYMLLVQLVF